MFLAGGWWSCSYTVRQDKIFEIAYHFKCFILESCYPVLIQINRLSTSRLLKPLNAPSVRVVILFFHKERILSLLNFLNSWMFFLVWESPYIVIIQVKLFQVALKPLNVPSGSLVIMLRHPAGRGVLLDKENRVFQYIRGLFKITFGKKTHWASCQ